MIVPVPIPENRYEVLIARKGFQALARRLGSLKLGSSAFVVTNPNIKKICGKTFCDAMNSAGIAVLFYTIPAAERSKSVEYYIRTVEAVARFSAKKRPFIAALGGGVVGDLAGFVAATYKRGIPYVQIPTTLLAQVDSAIGGKTAVDLPSGKNMLGAFYQPRLVYENIDLLTSLPARQIRSGLAEIIKYGVIYDAELFARLERNYQTIGTADPAALLPVIKRSVEIKAHVVAADERETGGLRSILNFGHTIGHALETATAYAKFTHGEAIAIGMQCAADVAVRLELLPDAAAARIEQLLQRYGLPVSTAAISHARILRAFFNDKKFIRGTIRMVLPTRIGHVLVAENIPLKTVKSVLQKRVSGV
ncbi:MAG: 3-dehydroquinate synthase [Candidatus Omnitrophica bacterium]|nr:3-dehydroquinate synthase [Candidatus Omnitrophota bacterium]